MLEKDIENLIAQYPESFFPDQGFTLIGQQVSLGRCRADLVFKDKHHRTIIIEVKRGILGREAAGQIIEYYGLLKQEDPDEIVELILCANIIPTERRTFLERVGIECKEIGFALIVDLARKYNYRFLDNQPKETVVVFGQPVLAQQSAEHVPNGSVWIFQANPERYDILNSLADPEIKLTGWTVNQQFKNRIHNGDVALIWISGKDAGIYAIAKVVSDPRMMKDSLEDDKYWVNESDRGRERLIVSIEIIKDMRNEPIFRRDLKNIQGLKDLSILGKFLQRTNFDVKQNEWEIIKGLIR